MDEYLIFKSRRPIFVYLIFSLPVILILVISIVRGSNRYFFGKLSVITLLGIIIIKLIYEFLDNNPVYIFNDLGIYKKEKKLASWDEISRYELKDVYGRYLIYKQVIIYNHVGEKIASIDLTDLAFNLKELEQIIKEKLDVTI